MVSAQGRNCIVIGPGADTLPAAHRTDVQDLARFGLRAVPGGTIATLMSATIAGVLINFG